MKLHKWVPLVSTLLAVALLQNLAGPALAAQEDKLKLEKKEKDLNYYLHMKGITWPTWLTNVVKQLRQVAGVDKAKVKNFKKAIFTIIPEKDKKPLPRAVWDAATKSGFTPGKLVTPEKTYKSRPPD